MIDAPHFPLTAEHEVFAYVQSLNETLPESFSDEMLGNGLPETEINAGQVSLSALIILSTGSATGFYFRPKEKHEAYRVQVRRNQELALQGKFNEMDFSPVEDLELSLQQLKPELVRLKNEALQNNSAATSFYVEVFLELNYPKDKAIDFLGLLKQLQISYRQTY